MGRESTLLGVYSGFSGYDCGPSALYPGTGPAPDFMTGLAKSIEQSGAGGRSSVKLSASATYRPQADQKPMITTDH